MNREPDKRLDPPRPCAPLWPYGATAGALVLISGALILEHRSFAWALRLVDAALLLAYARALWLRCLVAADDAQPAPRPDLTIWALGGLAVVSAVAGIVGAFGLVGVSVHAVLGLVCRVSVILSAARRASRLGPAGAHEVQLHNLRPVHATLASFALAILAGWALLTLPQATPNGQPALPPLDGLFTATSATCVTGLIVKDTPSGFSLFGKLVILALIQVGGLGIMTFASLFDILRRRSMSVRRRMIVGDLASRGEQAGIRATVAGIVAFTLSVELVGSLLLWLRWRGETGSAADDIFLSVFHSISAFCNAGFSLFSDSLEGYVGDPAVNLVIGSLIVVGGIGFPVVRSLWRQVQLKRRGIRRPLDLHTRLVLISTLYLLLIGFTGFLLLERGQTLRPLGPAGRLWAASFQGLTPRTAGFNTLPFGEMGPAALLFIMLLMVVGASPGSTGGGMKTTTAATLWLLGKAMISGSDRVPVFGREIPADVRHRAVAIASLFAVGIMVGTILLCASDGLVLEDAMFEVVSAIGTVGLSTGVTAGLSRLGKMLIIALMYAGRIGPLSLANAVQSGDERSARFPEEEVTIG